METTDQKMDTTTQEDSWAKPIDRLKVSDAPAGANNLNVDGRHLTSPLNGFGQLWQKTYQVRLENLSTSPPEVVSVWKSKLPQYMPDNSRFYPSLSGVKPGEILLINATLPGLPGGMPVSTGVMILYADDVSFSVMTPEGHPEAGFNTFSAYTDEGVTIAQIQSLARANDPIFEFGFRFLGGAKQQEHIWQHVLTQLATDFGVQAPQISTKAVCVDSKLQWSQAGNIWHNSVVRTTLSRPGYVLKNIFKRS
ncbi:MAG: hypothetical protein ACK2UW_05535 [Anaerolineales bacterium]